MPLKKICLRIFLVQKTHAPIAHLGTRKQYPILFTLIKERDTQTHAPIAQPVEQLPFKEKVPGSIPGGRTYKAKSVPRLLINF